MVLYACESWLEKARRVVGRPNEAVWQGVGSFDENKLTAYEGGDMVRLRQFARAESILDAALDRLSTDQHRHRATALIDRAEARLSMGEVEAACADAEEALRLVETVQHSGNLQRIAAISRSAYDRGANCGKELWKEVRIAKADYAAAIEATI